MIVITWQTTLNCGLTTRLCDLTACLEHSKNAQTLLSFCCRPFSPCVRDIRGEEEDQTEEREEGEEEEEEEDKICLTDGGAEEPGQHARFSVIAGRQCSCCLMTACTPQSCFYI